LFDDLTRRKAYLVSLGDWLNCPRRWVGSWQPW